MIRPIRVVYGTEGLVAGSMGLVATSLGLLVTGCLGVGDANNFLGIFVAGGRFGVT